MEWQLISAATIGSHHRDELMPRNGQDAFFYSYDPETGNGLAVVADGCGSSEYSEVGAHLGVRLLADIWDRTGRKTPGYHRFSWGHISPRSDEFLAVLISPLVEKLRVALLPLGDINTPDRLRDAVKHYGTFTLNGVVWNHDAMVFFCIGDGVTVINGKADVIEPPERDDPELTNAPQYLGYTVLDPTIPVDLRYYRVHSTASIQSFVIASDGFGPLLDAADTLLPGQRRTFGAISQFWTEDKYFQSAERNGEEHPPVRAQLLLNLAARVMKKTKRGPDGPLPDIETFPGLLDDDATFIVGRRRPDPTQPDTKES